MEYKILDKINNIYLDLTKYCVNGFGDIMTINGIVLMNQNDFEIQKNVYIVLGKNQFTDYEFCGVFAIEEKAQIRINEIVKEIPRLKNNLYIEKYKI